MMWPGIKWNLTPLLSAEEERNALSLKALVGRGCISARGTMFVKETSMPEIQKQLFKTFSGKALHLSVGVMQELVCLQSRTVTKWKYLAHQKVKKHKHQQWRCRTVEKLQSTSVNGTTFISRTPTTVVSSVPRLINSNSPFFFPEIVNLLCLCCFVNKICVSEICRSLNSASICILRSVWTF